MIRIPSTARPNQSVSCPHCSVSFSLAEVLDQQVPEVNFVEGVPVVQPVVNGRPIETPQTNGQVNGQANGNAEAPVIDTGKSKFQVPPQLSAGLRKKRRRRRRSSSSSSSSGTEAEETRRNLREEKRREKEALNPPKPIIPMAPKPEPVTIREEPASVQTSTSASATPNERRRARSRSRSSNSSSSAGEFLKIVFGGAIALPMAYLILMWVFGKDPFAIAPTINAFVPAAVPDYMVADDEGAEDSDAAPPVEPKASS